MKTGWAKRTSTRGSEARLGHKTSNFKKKKKNPSRSLRLPRLCVYLCCNRHSPIGTFKELGDSSFEESRSSGEAFGWWGFGSFVGKAPVCVEETRNWNIGAEWSRVIGLGHSGSGKEP